MSERSLTTAVATAPLLHRPHSASASLRSPAMQRSFLSLIARAAPRQPMAMARFSTAAPAAPTSMRPFRILGLQQIALGQCADHVWQSWLATLAGMCCAHGCGGLTINKRLAAKNCNLLRVTD